MPRLVIDGCDVRVSQGATILDAARQVGVDIPTMCLLDGHPPSASCMVCVVKVKANGQDRWVPSCAAVAEEGMEVESETEEVRQARRTALELLLSDHLGDCIAPCQQACPAHMNVPRMIRQITSGQLREAIVTVKQDIALPAVLGRICPEICEGRCRRGQVDAPVAVCLLKRYVADADLACDCPYVPPRRPNTGKRVAIVGAGPTGLSAAYYLLQKGHACTLFDEHPEPGGMLRYGVEEHRLPRGVLNAEIAGVERLGVAFRPGIRLGSDVALSELQRDFDAVLIAVGQLKQDEADRLGLRTDGLRLWIDARTYQTELAGVFAAGNAVHRGGRLAVRSVAEGKTVAHAIDAHLSGHPAAVPDKPFTTRVGSMSHEELRQFMTGVNAAPRTVPQGSGNAGFTPQEAMGEALRCLRCDCAKSEGCKLRRYAEAYGAKPARYRATHKPFQRHVEHPEIIYEPGKCIACGTCVRIAEQAGEPVGLTFLGRGFDVRVGVPFDGPLAAGLERVAVRCARACPTGALVRRRRAVLEKD